jgi:ribosome-binding protein aMBF1 (putative translation factor)
MTIRQHQTRSGWRSFTRSRPDAGHRLGDKSSPEQVFGHTLRGFRLKRGLSQQQLSDKSGYHRTYMDLLEGGQKSPSFRMILNLATILRVKASILVNVVERLVDRNESERHLG